MVSISPLPSIGLFPHSKNILRTRRRSSGWLLLLSIIGTALLAVTSLSAATTKTFLITNTSSDKNVQGSLTWAVYQANYQGADVNKFEFKIPGTSAGEVEIVLAETLYIARPMIIDATTQPGYAGKPLIRINCSKLNSGFHIVGNVAGIPPLSDGTASSGTGSSIQGFRIINYNNNAITITQGANSTLIANNYIGFGPTDSTGKYFRNVTVSPLCGGIGIQSNANVIRRNTISGAYNAITVGEDVDTPGAVTGAVFQKNRFEENFIGTDPTGLSKLGNDSDGIFFGGGVQQSLIGPGNVISGNGSAAIEFLHSTVTDNRIFGNMIGVNATGTEAIPNGELGILIANGASRNRVGGDGSPYSGNVIAASGFGGVAIGTAEFPGPDGSNENVVEGNFIGTDKAETKAFGSQLSGVTVQNKSKRNIIRRNVIVGQANHGVVLSQASNNAMYGNWIGVTSKGAAIPNGSFGVYLFDATQNTVQLPASSAGTGTERNVFGQNAQGPVGLYGTSAENIIALEGATSSRVLNISTRMRVDNGDNALIAGFIITGQAPKKVIVRALGTSLGIAGALSDPTLSLNTGAETITNDDWRTNQEQAIISSSVPPTSNLESAIVATLEPGAYTAIMRGKNNSTGVGLLEVYDLEASSPAVLANISTRGLVQTGENVMIAGFIVGGGTTDSRVVVRALGPSLAQSGVAAPLQDPTLQLIDGNGAVVKQNDNWQADAAQAAELTTIGVAPANAAEAALVAAVPPGAYTAVVADKDGRSGTGLVEVYSVP